MEKEKQIGYSFQEYYKYTFYLTLEDGTVIYNDAEYSDSIYRLKISRNGIAIKQDNGTYLVSGLIFVKS